MIYIQHVTLKFDTVPLVRYNVFMVWDWPRPIEEYSLWTF